VKPGPFRAAVLIGPRGAGKSTLLPRLAAQLGAEGIDTDQRLAEQVGMPAGAWLQARGEAEFRRVEAEVVRRALAVPGAAVVALGGGAVLDEGVATALLAADLLVVLLLAEPATLFARLQRDGTLRPPLSALPADQEVRELLRQRLPRYRSLADLELDTEEFDPERCVAAIATRMRETGR
jgi:shikimate kinase